MSRFRRRSNNESPPFLHQSSETIHLDQVKALEEGSRHLKEKTEQMHKFIELKKENSEESAAAAATTTSKPISRRKGRSAYTKEKLHKKKESNPSRKNRFEVILPPEEIIPPMEFPPLLHSRNDRMELVSKKECVLPEDPENLKVLLLKLEELSTEKEKNLSKIKNLRRENNLQNAEFKDIKTKFDHLSAENKDIKTKNEQLSAVVAGKNFSALTDENLDELFQKILEEKTNRSRCVVCMDKPRALVCTPCGHFSLCMNCSKCTNNTCPICRADVTSFTKIYT
jgi:myosin heavy subunit